MSKKLIKKCYHGDIIVKSDNTRIAFPVIKEKPIYIQPQSNQSYVSSDLRSPWLLQQGLKRAKIEYNKYIDEKNKELALKHALGLAAVTDAVMFVPDATDLITKGIKLAGKKYLLHKNAKLVSSLLNGTPTVTPIANNVGWGPRYTGQVVHKSKSSDPLILYNPKRWDVVNEGANSHGVWYLGERGVPRTVVNATEEKAQKAARARAIFEERPYTHEGELVLEKPIITVGEVPDRSVLSYQADNMGADGLIYNDVYDNGYNNNQVILSFKKHNNQLTKPVDSSVKFNTGLYTDFNKTTQIGDRWYDFSQVDPAIKHDLENILNTGDDDELVDYLYILDLSDINALLSNLGLTSHKKFNDRTLIHLYLNPSTPLVPFDVWYKNLSEANYRAFIRAIPNLPERTFIDVDPLLRNIPGFIPNRPYLTTIHNDLPVDILGHMNDSPIDHYWGDEILERLKPYGLDDSLQPMIVKNRNVITLPSYEISTAVSLPNVVYKSLTPVGFRGFHNSETGESFIDILGHDNDPTLVSTRHHEVVRHGTDDVVNHYKANDDYGAFFRFVDTSQFTRKNSDKPYELRATLSEILDRNVRKEMKEMTQEEFKRSLAVYLQYLDELDDDTLLSVLKSELSTVNGYGLDYARVLTKEGAKYLRKLMKYAPVIAGVSYTASYKTNNQILYKSGGKLIPRKK